MVHYRRFFCNRFTSLFKLSLLNSIEINKILKNYDLIVPNLVVLRGKVANKKFRTVFEYYNATHIGNDIYACRDVIGRTSPEYLNCFDSVMKGRTAFYLNMFIGRKNVIDQYCKWVFPILFKLQEDIDISNRNDYERRVFGFISELLFDVWISYNNKLKIKHISVLKTDQNKDAQLLKQYLQPIKLLLP